MKYCKAARCELPGQGVTNESPLCGCFLTNNIFHVVRLDPGLMVYCPWWSGPSVDIFVSIFGSVRAEPVKIFWLIPKC